MASIRLVPKGRAVMVACLLAASGCFTAPTQHEGSPYTCNATPGAGTGSEQCSSDAGTNAEVGGSSDSGNFGGMSGSPSAGAPTDSPGQAGSAQTTNGGRAGAEVNTAGAQATSVGGSTGESGASAGGGIDSGGAAAGGVAEGGNAQGGLVEGGAGQQGTAGQGGNPVAGGAPNLGGSSGMLGSGGAFATGGTPPTGGTGGAGPTAGAGGSIGDCNESPVTRVLGGLYVVQSNVWNAETVQCISVDGTSFSITRSEHDRVVPGLPASYPSIFVGCAGGTCSSGSLLPLSVRRVEMLRAYWKMSLPGTGAFNARYNLVFSKVSNGGDPNSAISMEIKIWLRALGGVSPAGESVVQGATILNEPWTIWFAQNASGDRGELAYVNTSASDESSHELLAFVRDAVDRGYIGETDVLTSVQAGFEIWKEGTGLTTSQFALDLNARSCGPEICNNADDNCDGQTDEGLGLGEPCKVGIGACATTGSLVCASNQLTPVCSAVAGLPGTEACDADYRDEDCDGLTNEGCACVPGTSPDLPCGASSVGACRMGVQRCAGGSYALCEGAVLPSAELCDGIDNDCNGQTDEDFAIGQSCSTGVGACSATGVRICASDQMTATCNIAATAPGTEICDPGYLDEDCDGLTNEGCACVPGTSPDLPCGASTVGACRMGVQRCIGGAYALCEGAVLPAAELCDGIDNDCDGQADEDFGLGQSCNVGIGACAATGTRVCAANQSTAVCSVVAKSGGAEICDAAYADEDCDGLANESCACIPGVSPDLPCGANGVGACRMGVQRCLGGTYASCEGAVFPTSELCDGIDNDCDGQVDEDFTLGQACRTGTGTCSAAGTRVCAPNQLSGVCNAVAGSPGTEICDAAYADEDCDGLTNEGCGCVPGTSPDLPCGASNVGTCRMGVQRCVNASYATCNGAVLPSSELCDGADNDCDGQVDEDFALGQPCQVGVGACAATGMRVCASNQLASVCSATAKSAANEICDAAYVDEDCDGQTNEGCACVPGTSPDLPCGANSVGACKMGVLRCVGGTYATCNGAVYPASELCDGIDNDCDGQVDKDFGLGQPCQVGVGACNATGSRVCASNQLTAVCNAIARSAGTEICDTAYVDEDCDGLTNEGCGCVPGVSPDISCGASSVGGCRMGVQRCVGGSYAACNGAIYPSAELCDAIDNDCDGQVDEDFGLGQTCQAGIGACSSTGTRVCASNLSTAVCNAIPGTPTTETCNDVDDNCDGLADYTIAAGRAESACLCGSLPIKPKTGAREPAEVVVSPSVCTVSSDGVMSMTFNIGACASPYPWAQCKFDSVNLQGFDADQVGHGGVLEVRFCTDQYIYSGLSLYYGAYPKRKRLDLLTDQESTNGLAPGCYVRYRAPSDANCPVFTSLTDPPVADLPLPCRNGCQNGRWSDQSSQCAFSYSGVPVWLTAEFCRANTPPPLPVTVSNLTVRHLEQTCICLDNQQCKDPSRRFCDGSAALPSSQCSGSARCAGVCVASQ